jgi:hypothetical protein
MPAVGQEAGAPALANQLQNALPPVILGTGRDFTSDTGIEIELQHPALHESVSRVK